MCPPKASFGHLVYPNQLYLLFMKEMYEAFSYLFDEMNYTIYEPFGLGRFATDLSLTKAAPRPLFARVRRYAPQGDQ